MDTEKEYEKIYQQYQPKSSVKKDYQQILLDDRDKIKSRSCEDISFSSPLIVSNDIGVIYPSTITVIQGKKGVHKSRFTEMLIALAICQQEGSFLGLKVRLEGRKLFVLYVDTERNQNDQLPYAIQRTKLKAGYDKDEWPDNLDCLSLVNIPRADRFEALKDYITNIRKNKPDYHLVIAMDVITDCVENFNDVKESMKLIDMMNELINQHNAMFIAVVHENPGAGSEKARGHIGTEIINKASQVIQVGFQGEDKSIIVVKFIHSRNTGPIPPIFLRYDQETRGLVLADPAFIAMAIENQQEKAPLPQVRAWMEEKLLGQMSKTKLMETLLADFGGSPRTLEKRLKALVEEGFINRLNKNGSAVYYELKPPF